MPKSTKFYWLKLKKPLFFCWTSSPRIDPKGGIVYLDFKFRGSILDHNDINLFILYMKKIHPWSSQYYFIHHQENYIHDSFHKSSMILIHLHIVFIQTLATPNAHQETIIPVYTTSQIQKWEKLLTHNYTKIQSPPSFRPMHEGSYSWNVFLKSRCLLLETANLYKETGQLTPVKFSRKKRSD